MSLENHRLIHYKTLSNHKNRELLLGSILRILEEICIDPDKVTDELKSSVKVCYEFLEEIKRHQEPDENRSAEKYLKQKLLSLIEEELKNNYKIEGKSLQLYVTLPPSFIKDIILLFIKGGDLTEDLIVRYEKSRESFLETFEFSELFTEDSVSISKRFYNIIELL